LTGLAIGCHWADVIKLRIKDSIMIFEKLEKENPKNYEEVIELIHEHCKEIVYICYSLAMEKDQIIASKKY